MADANPAPVTYAPITDYTSFSFTGPLFANGEDGKHTFKRPVYVRGPETGAPVLVIQELPGIMPETFRLCDMLVAEGFRVYLPHLFGPLGKMSMFGNLARVFCMRREFALLEANKTSPIVNWLRALCQQIRTDTGAKGVGAIGMCLTGNFAISLMADDAVLAGVASQPSMPLFKEPAALHMSEADVAEVNIKLEEVGPMLGYRFEGDKFCTGAKFKALDQAFNSGGTEKIKLKTLPGEGHSVLTGHFVDEAGHPTREAFEEVVSYFRVKLA